MPNYAFHCDNPECEHPDFEMIVPLAMFEDIKDGIDCPICEKGHATRLPAAPGFSLKGGGFHINDYHAYGPRR